MTIDNDLLDRLEMQARESVRLRAALDLRTSASDTSQRLLNALCPGTVVPIHRHPSSAETVTILRGSVVEVFYDAEGHETERVTLDAGKGVYGIQIPAGQWHTVDVTVPCVILEVKDGAYAPASPEDLMK